MRNDLIVEDKSTWELRVNGMPFTLHQLQRQFSLLLPNKQSHQHHLSYLNDDSTLRCDLTVFIHIKIDSQKDQYMQNLLLQTNYYIIIFCSSSFTKTSIRNCIDIIDLKFESV